MADRDFPDFNAVKSGNGHRKAADRRVRRTRGALIDAWNHLVLSRMQRVIRVSDIVDQAKVGRSTFYDHYASTEALHLDALRRPFSLLADAAAGRGEEEKLTRLLEHFWDYRARARHSFDEAAERLLASMIEERLDGESLIIPTRIAARQLAAAALTPIVTWVRAEAWCAPAELARAIRGSAEAQLAALRVTT